VIEGVRFRQRWYLEGSFAVNTTVHITDQYMLVAFGCQPDESAVVSVRGRLMIVFAVNGWACSTGVAQGWVSIINPEHGPLTSHLSVEDQPLPAMLSGKGQCV
jgi:hypothetical protein